MMEGFSICAFIGPGGPEFIVVMLVLLLMFGAKDAPRIFRKLNEMINSLRSTADGFKREIMYGDLNSDATDPVADHHDPEYAEYIYEEDYMGEDELEKDYSDETFRDLEQDLEGQKKQGDQTGESGLMEHEGSEEDDDAQKA